MAAFNSASLMTFLQHYLGELYLVNAFDTFDVIEKKDAKEELIPLNKLKEYIEWRKSELDENIHNQDYLGERDDLYPLEAKLVDGKPLLALVCRDLYYWEAKLSYPYVLIVTFKFTGDSNGLPNNDDELLMNEYELKLSVALKDKTKYVKFGTQTAANTRNLIILTKEYRDCSLIADNLRKEYRFSLKSIYVIYRDKYWKSLEHFDNDLSLGDKFE